MPMMAAIAWVISVAMAAPITPYPGTGSQPKISSGASTKFRNTVPSTM